MTVQDWVLSACQWGFLLALVPSLLSKDKPVIGTSVMTGMLLAIMAITFATLALWVSAISTAIVALAWFVLAGQRIMR